uniref:Phospholipase A2 n=1 Tax=Capra hircus TaxID=9925 RepID=A0A452G7Q8_CAPHI
MERLTPRGPPGHPHQREASTCWRLTVKVLEARGLGWADLLSEADPYVILQLPTAPGTKFKTKTVTNSSHPVWNETFTFLIQGEVKVKVRSSPVLLPGKSHGQRSLVGCSPWGRKESDTTEWFDFSRSDRPENLITNNVWGSGFLFPCACLSSLSLDQDELELVLKGSYEDTQTSALGTASAFCFHYMAAQEAELSGCLRSSISSGWNSGSSAGHLTVPLRSLAMGKEVTIDVPATNASGVKLHLKAESCPEELAVHLGFDLCVEERAFLSRRKQVVAKALKQALQLDGELQEDEVCGGRGTWEQTPCTGPKGLPDCCALSRYLSHRDWGMGMTMAHLYGDPEWSQKDLKGPISHVREHLAKSKLEAFSPECLASYHRELEQRAEQGHTTTFVDLWGLVLEFMLHGQVGQSGRQEAEACWGAVSLALVRSAPPPKLTVLSFLPLWVEFSPYEVGFLKYGAFVPPELFGSEFFMGRLMKRLPESRICFLEGIWSNIFSLNLLDAWYDLTSSGDTWRQHIRDKIRDLEVPPASSGTSSWPEALWMQPGTALAQTFKGFLTSRPLYQHSSNFLRGLQMHKDYCAQKDFTTWADCRPDSSPNQLTPQEPQLCLVDAGYFINTSCPAMFRPGRRLDLIISFDYSLSSPFEVLQQTELDFRARGLPFPRVEPSPEDRRQPRECHLFSDPACPDAPVLLHFPLVNASFKDHSAPGVRRGPAELSAGQIDLTGVTSPYSMFNMTYKEEDFDRLVQLSDYNVRSSQDTILQALRTVLKRRAPEARPPRVQT